ncbi:saccharopine dehydrogenase NADP-binding domain-containing protein [Bacillus sp. B1-b2]|uniref:saccharopine dehydrogenase NADP-binding domain-containing protein n=1 Tax=Bacillus sp. B1-b2 TaxID=2653201 RepID=UPI001262119C|nr:saccharopine dehydrogenase NADP-binding domain-containing protein [Bacillus sp. B1-b2]KAB7672851.1 hypothetical protein F9279_00020 [Bacillus sp. B1-b2]
MRDKILVIGGHGHVGNVIVESLLKRGVSNIVIGGRNEQKMKEYVNQVNSCLTYQLIDVEGTITSAYLENIRMVVMCINQNNTEFVKYCIAEKIDYVDISANSDFMEKVHQLPKKQDVSIITHVGIAPGVTNLMVKKYVSMTSQKEKDITIDVILGIGDAHGKAAIEWTFSQMNSNYLLGDEKIESFKRERNVQFSTPIGMKKTYSFNFADQHVLRKEYQETLVTTYLGFDVVFISKILFYLKKWNLLRILSSSKVISLLQKIMNKQLVGSGLYALKVSNSNNSDPNAIVLYGKKEAEATGEVAAFVIKKLLDTKKKYGITTINSVCSLEDVLQEVSVIMEGGPFNNEKRLA